MWRAIPSVVWRRGWKVVMVVRPVSCNLKRFWGRLAVTSAFLMLLCATLKLTIRPLLETETGGLQHESFDNITSIEEPVVLWWTPFTKQAGQSRKCGKHRCYFTEDRRFLHHQHLYAVMFYGSELSVGDLPLPRNIQHDWALLHEESPKNNFLFCMASVMSWFNHTATFRRNSDLPLTLQYLTGVDDLASKKFFRTTEEKNWATRNQNLAPVAYVQSDCDTPIQRDAYVQELMKHIAVDSYGKCIHNADLPYELSDAMQAMDDERFWHLLARYKFHLAIENAIADDYITEKLWRPLVVGSVPVYAGSPSVSDWLPNGLQSSILIANYSTPRQLAERLKEIDRNDSTYDSFLMHKNRGEVANEMLKATLQARTWGVNNEREKPNFVELFECLVCERVWHRRANTTARFQADKSHYSCDAPKSLLKEGKASWWNDRYKQAIFEAQALDHFLVRNMHFKDTDFENKMQEIMH
ncbi:alpha-(1,3)-fucosyltransferase 10-like [Ornithodoros turicata]|uniref:alpha-(1,3)-fucosyltransferase 10-like n=1 Tax=Ornithodoros turicata TaxID=34597 RepID=UPI003139C30F